MAMGRAAVRDVVSHFKYQLLMEYYPYHPLYGIFAYIYHTNQPNVVEYTSPMDGLWMVWVIGKNHRSLFSRTKFHQISKRKLKGPKLASS